MTMSSTLIIEKLQSMNEIEATELAKLIIEVVEDGASIGFLAPLPDKEAITYWKSVISPDVFLWVAKMNGRMIGTIQLHLATKPNATHRAEIAKLMVHPEYRGRGIAKQLMDTAEQAAIKLNRSLLVLDTRHGDVSNELYKKLGYVEAGYIPYFARSSNGNLDGTVLYYKRLTTDDR